MHKGIVYRDDHSAWLLGNMQFCSPFNPAPGAKIVRPYGGSSQHPWPEMELLAVELFSGGGQFLCSPWLRISSWFWLNFRDALKKGANSATE
jgi:hypothetical protein